MIDIFETFKPENSLIATFVDYYYLDVKPNNVQTKFECFPHYNNTLSLYKSHSSPKKGTVLFENNVLPLQLFTPTRERVLEIVQLGKVHRIVIVFHPLGIQQFYRGFDFSHFISDVAFFNPLELSQLFATHTTVEIASLLDQFLLDRFRSYTNNTLSNAVSFIIAHSGSSSIENIAAELSVSRRHLNRLFSTHFGISVKRFNEIVLFRKTLEHKLFENPTQNFTSLAHEFNYYDQSHLNRAFKNFTSNSPKRLLNQGTLLGKENVFWHLKS